MRKIYALLLLPLTLFAFASPFQDNKVDKGNTFNAEVNIDNPNLKANIDLALRCKTGFIFDDDLDELEDEDPPALGYSLDEGKTYHDLEKYVFEQLEYTFDENGGNFTLKASIGPEKKTNEATLEAFEAWINKELQINPGNTLSIYVDVNTSLVEGTVNVQIVSKKAILAKCTRVYDEFWDENDYYFEISQDSGATWIDLNEYLVDNWDDLKKLDFDVSLQLSPGAFSLQLGLVTGEEESTSN